MNESFYHAVAVDCIALAVSPPFCCRIYTDAISCIHLFDQPTPCPVLIVYSAPVQHIEDIVEDVPI